MSKHAMTIEGKAPRKRKAVKTTRKKAAINRKLRWWDRQARTALGAIGLITVVFILFRLITGGI